MAPSMGVYGYKPKVIYSFGFPRAIAAGGVEMDLPGQKDYNATLNGNREQLIGFRLHNGLLGSALEHSIPEQMFVTPEAPGEGISAVKALSKAAQQGQRIYHITQANAATALPNIHIDAAAKNEIIAALNAGKDVTTHTDPISVPGWSGAGYIIFDPVTGDGAYKISGGANGGWLFWGTVFFLAIVVALSFISGSLLITAIALYNYYKFMERVEAISKSNLPAGKMSELLNQAAFLSVISMLNGLLPIYSQLGVAGQALKIWVSGFLMEIGLMWF